MTHASETGTINQLPFFSC